MPPTSPTEIPTIQAARSASSERSHTPPSSGTLLAMWLAMWLASWASVLVDPNHAELRPADLGAEIIPDIAAAGRPGVHLEVAVRHLARVRDLGAAAEARVVEVQEGIPAIDSR